MSNPDNARQMVGAWIAMGGKRSALKCLKPALWLVLTLTVMGSGCVIGPRGFPPVGGIANFDQVNARLYRGAQPNHLGLKHLQSLGIKTIVNLRQPDDTWPAEADASRALGMKYFNVPMAGVGAPTVGDIQKVFSIIDQSSEPVYVHCEYGCDRTGVIIACYRMRYDGWRGGQALAEARTYGMSRWQIQMKRFIMAFEKAST